MIGRAIFFLRLLLASMLVLLAGSLAAHSTPNSEVRFRVAGDVVIADIIVPRSEYAFGTGNPVDNSIRSRRIARDYLRQHFDVSSPTAQPWSVSLQTVEFVTPAGPPDLHAVAQLTPPPGASLDKFVVDWRILNDTVPGHFALFLSENNTSGSDGAILGASQAGTGTVEISLAGRSALQAFGDAVALGAHHILEGYDHLLFLLVLLLPAPLVAGAGQWSGRQSTGLTIKKLVQIVTAFTIGHSITLIAASVWKVSLPSAPVEVAIAVSVLVSAMHAARPLLPGREPLVALIFGLVHGLAFATLVQEANAGAANSAFTLLGFNLGIELVQLAIVAAVAPSLLVLSRYPLYSAFRWVLALFSAGAAIAWIVNRTTGLAEATVANLETALAMMGWLVPVVALIALVLQFRRSSEAGLGVGVQAAST